MATILEVLYDHSFKGRINQHRIYWRTVGANAVCPGKVRHSVLLTMHSGKSQEETVAIAELLALKWLLINPDVIDATFCGRGMTISTSSPEVAKVKAGGCKYKRLLYHRHLFTTRFYDAQYITSTDKSWVEREPVNDACLFEICEHDCVDDLVYTDAAGPILITHHALARFMERKNIRDMSRAWQRLVPLLREGNWSKGGRWFVMSEEPLKMSETWSVKCIRRRPFLVVVARQGDQARLVTAMGFQPRKDNHRGDNHHVTGSVPVAL